MSTLNTKFLKAAEVADYNVSHYWEFPVFQPGILDFIDRNITILPRISSVPATGQPSRYKEQTKLPTNAEFADPRTGVSGGSYGLATIDDDYGRVEKYVTLKCLVSRIKYSMFDKELVQQQGTEVETLTKDYNDMLSDLYMFQNDKIWNGAATSPEGSASNEYSGILKQVSTKVSIATPYDFTNKTGDMITDQIRLQIAKQMSAHKYTSFPTAVYADPIIVDRIINEERNRDGVRALIPDSMELKNGWKVPTISTAIGNLPLITDAYLPSAANTTDGTKTDHTIAVINERLVERHYLTSSTPRIFKMSLDSTLIDDYIAILFDALVVKGADYSHFLMNISI